MSIASLTGKRRKQRRRAEGGGRKRSTLNARSSTSPGGGRKADGKQGDIPPVCKLNTYGVVTRPATIRVSLPKTLKAKASVGVAYLSGPQTNGKPGWRAEFDCQCYRSNLDSSLSPITVKSTPHPTRLAAVSDCLERLAQDWEGQANRASGIAAKVAASIATHVRDFRMRWLIRHKQDLAASPGAAMVPTVPPSAVRPHPSASPPPSTNGRQLATLPPPTRLCVGDRKRLAALEKTIDSGKEVFRGVGEALAEIRAKQLFRETHDSFEAYCRERFGFGKSEAYDKIKAADVARSIAPLAAKLHLPAPNEDWLKQLAPLEEADRKEVFQVAAKRATKEGVPLTAKMLREERIRYEKPEDEPEQSRVQRQESRDARPSTLDSRPSTPSGPLAEAKTPPDLQEASHAKWMEGVGNLSACARTLAHDFPDSGYEIAFLLVDLVGEVAPQFAKTVIAHRCQRQHK